MYEGFSFDAILPDDTILESIDGSQCLDNPVISSLHKYNVLNLLNSSVFKNSNPVLINISVMFNENGTALSFLNI
jgi:hypothetical protein